MTVVAWLAVGAVFLDAVGVDLQRMIVDGKTDELLSVIPMPYEIPGMFSITRIEIP